MLSTLSSPSREQTTIEVLDFSFFGVVPPSDGTKIFSSKRVELMRKIDEMRASGHRNVKIVSDFDYTITKCWVGQNCNIRGASCHKIVEDSGLLSDEYRSATEKLQQKYYPIENDPNIPIPAKAIEMENWANEASVCMLTAGISKTVITKAVEIAIQSKNAQLRALVDRFFELVASHAIPMLIFSAGIADVLEEVVRSTLKVEINNPASKIYCVSNRCVYDSSKPNYEDLPILGFTSPTIHVFNKKSATFLDTPFFKETDEASRDNVILLGDSVGDLLMTEGLSHNPNHLLRIGFLNVNVDERLKQYTDLYDIVIAGNESTFEIPVAILESICRI